MTIATDPIKELLAKLKEIDRERVHYHDLRERYADDVRRADAELARLDEAFDNYLEAAAALKARSELVAV